MAEARGLRRENWRRHLDAEFERVREEPWDWSAQAGVNCVSAWCDCVVAITDPPWDPGAAYRGMFNDEAEAMAIVDAAGGWAAFMDELFGEAARIPPLESEEGDVWIVEMPVHGVTCGMRLESAVHFKWPDERTLRIPLDRAAGMPGAMAWASAR